MKNETGSYPELDPGALLLQRELVNRVKHNPRYSMRAFAKSLGISHAFLSMVLAGKRVLTRKKKERIADVLALSPVERQRLFKQDSDQSRSRDPIIQYREIDLDAFTLISDWYHLAILSLLEIPEAKVAPHWLAARLGITTTEASLAVQRLKRMRLIGLVKGRWKQIGSPFDLQNKTSTAATRKYQKQLLEKALESLESVPIQKRDYSSMTLAMDPKLLPYAARRIDRFRKQLTEELESQGEPKAVYQFAIQFFPVTKESL